MNGNIINHREERERGRERKRKRRGKVKAEYSYREQRIENTLSSQPSTHSR